MSRFRLIPRLAAALAVAGIATSAMAQYTIDFSSSRGTGVATDKVLIENIRVLVPVVNPFDPTTNTTIEKAYNLTFRFDSTTLHLVPYSLVQTGGSGANNCANLSVQVYNSVQGTIAPLAGATVTIGTRSATTDSSGVASFTGLAEGAVSVSVASNGYTSATQSATLTCSGSSMETVALSPAAGTTGGLASGQFRMILTWGQSPTDLDSHITGPTISGSRSHVYFSSRDGGAGSACALDVDDTTSYGPETVTCPATSSAITGATQLVSGIYRYSVHHYGGSGDIGGSDANVRLEFANGAVYNYTPPSGTYRGTGDVWTVFELTVDSAGSVSVAPVNTITNGVSASAVRNRKPGAIRFGQPEPAGTFLGLTK